jgi:hypothetical protein
MSQVLLCLCRSVQCYHAIVVMLLPSIIIPLQVYTMLSSNCISCYYPSIIMPLQVNTMLSSNCV